MDNLSIDSEGHVWAACEIFRIFWTLSFVDINRHLPIAFPKILITVGKHFEDPSLPAPSSALRFSINTGPNAFYGEKYKVDKVRLWFFVSKMKVFTLFGCYQAFEDDGHIASGITTVVHDARHRRLFLHGKAFPLGWFGQLMTFIRTCCISSHYLWGMRDVSICINSCLGGKIWKDLC